MAGDGAARVAAALRASLSEVRSWRAGGEAEACGATWPTPPRWGGRACAARLDDLEEALSTALDAARGLSGPGAAWPAASLGRRAAPRWAAACAWHAAAAAADGTGLLLLACGLSRCYEQTAVLAAEDACRALGPMCDAARAGAGAVPAAWRRRAALAASAAALAAPAAATFAACLVSRVLVTADALAAAAGLALAAGASGALLSGPIWGWVSLAARVLAATSLGLVLSKLWGPGRRRVALVDG
mmetsp:Transcript_6389/g.22482  ORF Transcript_6389/g.22482 Transcript_6389/m.22482 type:complete len:244 (-) Transcript_6389:594-1325(-)